MSGGWRRWNSVFAIGLHKCGLDRGIAEREFCREILKIAKRRQKWVVLSRRRAMRGGKRGATGSREVTKRSEYWF
jgi:hypothetical protein